MVATLLGARLLPLGSHDSSGPASGEQAGSIEVEGLGEVHCLRDVETLVRLPRSSLVGAFLVG